MRLLSLLVLATPAAAQLTLTPAGTLGIAPLGVDAIGGATYDSDIGHLWVCDGFGSVNDIFELDPTTGAVISQFNADVIPGLVGGPDALALDPLSGNLAVFGAIGGAADGLVTQSGQLVATWSGLSFATAAAFTEQGELWVWSFFGNRLMQLDPLSGGLIQDVFPAGVPTLTALVYDPQNTTLFGLGSLDNILYEIAIPSGALLSVTDLNPFGVDGGFPAGIAFGPGGNTLYLIKGYGAASDAVAVFDRAGTIGGVFCSPAVPNSTGQPAWMIAAGSDVAGGNPLTLRMMGLPPNQFGFFLCSQAQGFTPMAGGSQGDLCLQLPIGRFQQQLANSGPGGVIAISVDTLALPMTPPVAVQAGETWNFQGWYRDQNPGNTSNFTSGVEIVFQ